MKPKKDKGPASDPTVIGRLVHVLCGDDPAKAAPAAQELLAGLAGPDGEAVLPVFLEKGGLDGSLTLAERSLAGLRALREGRSEVQSIEEINAVTISSLDLLVACAGRDGALAQVIAPMRLERVARFALGMVELAAIEQRVVGPDAGISKASNATTGESVQIHAPTDADAPDARGEPSKRRGLTEAELAILEKAVEAMALAARSPLAKALSRRNGTLTACLALLHCPALAPDRPQNERARTLAVWTMGRCAESPGARATLQESGVFREELMGLVRGSEAEPRAKALLLAAFAAYDRAARAELLECGLAPFVVGQLADYARGGGRSSARAASEDGTAPSAPRGSKGTSQKPSAAKKAAAAPPPDALSSAQAVEALANGLMFLDICLGADGAALLCTAEVAEQADRLGEASVTPCDGSADVEAQPAAPPSARQREPLAHPLAPAVRVVEASLSCALAEARSAPAEHAVMLGPLLSNLTLVLAHLATGPAVEPAINACAAALARTLVDACTLTAGVPAGADSAGKDALAAAVAEPDGFKPIVLHASSALADASRALRFRTAAHAAGAVPVLASLLRTSLNLATVTGAAAGAGGAGAMADASLCDFAMADVACSALAALALSSAAHESMRTTPSDVLPLLAVALASGDNRLQHSAASAIGALALEPGVRARIGSVHLDDPVQSARDAAAAKAVSHRPTGSAGDPRSPRGTDQQTSAPSDAPVAGTSRAGTTRAGAHATSPRTASTHAAGKHAAGKPPGKHAAPQSAPPALAEEAPPDPPLCLPPNSLPRGSAARVAVAAFAAAQDGAIDSSEPIGKVIAQLVELLRGSADGGVRQACAHAISALARDEVLAIKLVDAGAVHALHALQTGASGGGIVAAADAAGAAAEALLRLAQHHAPTCLWMSRRVPAHMCTREGFYALPTGAPFLSHSQVSNLPRTEGHREVLTADPASDVEMHALVGRADAELAGCDPAAAVRALARIVDTRLGGKIQIDQYEASSCASAIYAAKIAVQSDAIPITRLSYGSCRHRAILFKVLADHTRSSGLAVSLCLGERNRGAHADVAWNEIAIDGECV
jgi:hypothetical protein